MGRIILNGKKYMGGGGSGDVADVEVNGISVVDAGTKIAEITSYEEVSLAEYESIPVAERESNGIAYFIKDLNNSNVQGYPPLIYSDEEREIGVWRDGKPLYQKVVKSTTTPTANAWNTVALPPDISVKIFDAYYVRTTGAIDKFSLYRSDTNPVEMLVCSLSDSTVYYRISSPFVANFSEFVIIIQYTKTTDTAGSGRWTTQGTLAQHYSTTERLIGTWVDGKPLYQKTIHIGALTPTDNIVAHGIGNIERVIDIKGYSDQGGRWFPLPYVQTQNLIGYQEKVYVDGTNVYVNLLNDDYISDCYVTIQYTKTTD